MSRRYETGHHRGQGATRRAFAVLGERVVRLCADAVVADEPFRVQARSPQLSATLVTETPCAAVSVLKPRRAWANRRLSSNAASAHAADQSG